MPDIIQMNYTVLRNAQDRLDSAPQQIQTMLATLQEALAPISASFEGAAAEQYEKIKIIWADTVADMQQVLSHFGPTLNEAQYRTMTTDNNLFDEWSQIK